MINNRVSKRNNTHHDEEQGEESPNSKKRRVDHSEDEELCEDSGIYTAESGDSKSTDETNFKMYSSGRIDLAGTGSPSSVFEKHEAEVGIIEKITLINFMCHTMLEVPFGSNVNFVIGRNGSGKSAIMTAIVVGLGGKANTTSRGNSLKGFIKDKCSYAQISVQIKNRGKDSYRKDEYGNSIIVDRRITSDGNSAYKIKSCDGRTISNKKEELNHILDQFGIQIDNPLSILNQDTSRYFLNTSNPEDKYKLFLKGTYLFQLSSDYGVVSEEQSIAKKVLQIKSQEFKETQSEVAKLEERYKDIKQLKNIEEQIVKLKNERVWAEVIELEKRLVPLENEVKHQKDRRPRYQQQVVDCQNEIERLNEEWQSVQESMKSVTEEAKSVQTHQEKIALELRQKKNIYREKQSNLRKLKQELSSAKCDEKQLKEKLEEMKKITMQDLETERIQRQQELESKREELKSHQNLQSMANHHREQLERAISNDKEKCQMLRNERTCSSKAIDSLQRNIQNLQSSKGNRLTIFGKWFPELLNKIEQAVKRNVFHRRPVGPIGHYLTLNNQCWALAIEACLKDYLFAFCCHDNHDKVALLQIMHQVCPKNMIPKIVMGRFLDHMHDVSRNKPRCSYTTVLDELVVDNVVIANCLIDQLAVESVLLIQTEQEARDVMFFRLPQGARKAFSGQGDEITGGRSAKSFSFNRENSKYLQKDMSQQLSNLRIELDLKKNSHQQLQQELTQLEVNIKDNQVELQKLKSKASKEQKIIDNLLMEISELEEDEEEDLPDVSTLEEDLLLCTQQVEELDIQMSQTEEESESAQEEVEKKEEEREQHREKIQEVMEKHEPLKKELDKLIVKIAEEETKRKHLEDKCQGVDVDIKNAEMRLKEMQKVVKETTHQASQYCTRIETTRTVKQLETEIVQKEKALKLKEQNHNKHEEITMQYFKGCAKVMEIKDSIQNVQRYQQRIDEAFERRCVAYKEFRGLISLRAKMNFIMTLSQRGYTGKMTINHKKEILELEVKVDQGSKKASKDTRSLSGGERSFATISFIMALWETIETPFRCLDEFDVFMDMVNRRISMNMLLQAGQETPNRQFILLTPQDMSAVEGGPTLKIFKLKDPER